MAGRSSWSEAERRRALSMGARIAAARIARGLTQDALARKLGMPQSRIAAVEIGRTSLTRRTIAQAVGIHDSEITDV